ncbi:hypothetical protein DFH08DRAFT_822862 [Mycena albidolilacea]|uniref:Uncharacterized protein n=1 Tax=Mycena albidolilacea TaxID=1033008 RepID=A0AAD6Z746_9AGAR|nr:hypothetical protein DFH08DRAFT_822862 [Mycena albidolilacea]
MCMPSLQIHFPMENSTFQLELTNCFTGSNDPGSFDRMAIQLDAGEVRDSQFSDPELNDTPAPPPMIFQNVFPPIPGPIQNPPPINPPVSSVQQAQHYWQTLLPGANGARIGPLQACSKTLCSVSGAYRAGTRGEAKYSRVQNHKVPSTAIAGSLVFIIQSYTVLCMLLTRLNSFREIHQSGGLKNSNRIFSAIVLLYKKLQICTDGGTQVTDGREVQNVFAFAQFLSDRLRK